MADFTLPELYPFRNSSLYGNQTEAIGLILRPAVEAIVGLNFAPKTIQGFQLNL